MKRTLRLLLTVGLSLVCVSLFAQKVPNYPIPQQPDTLRILGIGNSFTDEAFYEKTVFETRVFRPEFYLFPIPQSEINRDPQIVQNPGW